MVTHRELLEAQIFQRRRLVRAFLSGRAEGPEVEPVRFGRCQLLGVVVTVLLVLGHLAAHAMGWAPVELP